MKFFEMFVAVGLGTIVGATVCLLLGLSPGKSLAAGFVGSIFGVCGSLIGRKK